MIYTTKQTKESILKKTIKILSVAAFWIFMWEAVSRLAILLNPNMQLLLPGPFLVLKKWWEIAFTFEFLKAELLTLARVFFGFFASVFIGALLGFLTHISKLAYSLISPILKIIRSVPVVAIIVLLYIFVKSNIMPTLIVGLMVVPIIWQTVNDGLDNIDVKLLEFAKVYQLSYIKTLLRIKIPSILPIFISSCSNALGLAWKSGIAAEVLCKTNNSLGVLISDSKTSWDYDVTYAVTLNVVLLSIIIEFLLKFIVNKYLIKNGGAVND
ncbi:MAG: ABC transporter permease subunit [Clostridia bacterium]|nr:ABC transporter permease subunit [Clostridia bacterium]